MHVNYPEIRARREKENRHKTMRDMSHVIVIVKPANREARL